jgi:hypothetical protein
MKGRDNIGDSGRGMGQKLAQVRCEELKQTDDLRQELIPEVGLPGRANGIMARGSRI